MKRWGWLIAGIGAGVALGLLLGWVVWPVQYYDTSPSELRADYKNDYVRLVALAYAVDRDLDLAKDRLERLDPVQPTLALVTVTESLIAGQAPTATIVPLVHLARDLGSNTAGMAPYLRGEVQ